MAAALGLWVSRVAVNWAVQPRGGEQTHLDSRTQRADGKEPERGNEVLKGTAVAVFSPTGGFILSYA